MYQKLLAVQKIYAIGRHDDQLPGSTLQWQRSLCNAHNPKNTISSLVSLPCGGTGACVLHITSKSQAHHLPCNGRRDCILHNSKTPRRSSPPLCLYFVVVEGLVHCTQFHEHHLLLVSLQWQRLLCVLTEKWYFLSCVSTLVLKEDITYLYV